MFDVSGMIFPFFKKENSGKPQEDDGLMGSYGNQQQYQQWKTDLPSGKRLHKYGKKNTILELEGNVFSMVVYDPPIQTGDAPRLRSKIHRVTKHHEDSMRFNGKTLCRFWRGNA